MHLLKVSLVYCFVLCHFFIVYAQSSWLVTVSGKTIGSAYVARLDSVSFWAVQHIRSDESLNPFNVLHITVFDECGYKEAFEVSSPQIYDFKQILYSWVDGDSVRLALSINPIQIHSHTVSAVMAIHKFNYGTQMSFLMADNINYLISFKPIGNNKFLSFHFLSYTERPTQYACFITDKYLNIEKSFVNFNEFTITGDAQVLTDGYVFSTSKSLIKLDHDFKFLWAKHMPTNFIIGQFKSTSDGFIGIIRDRQRNYIALYKFSNSGDIIWKSANLMPEGVSSIRISSLLNDNDILYVAVLYNSPQSTDVNHLQVCEIDPNSGNVINVLLTPPLPQELLLQQVVKDDFGNIFLLSNTGNDISGLININHSADCNIEPGGSTSNLPDVNFATDMNTYTSNQDVLWNATTTLQTNLSSSEIGDLCRIEEIKDLMPDSDTICDGESVTIDLSHILYPVIWDDGFSEKRRIFTVPGEYGFRINHCQINHHEKILISEGECSKIFLPNSFTPNNDGINDEWKLSHSPDITIKHIRIFNRWGALIFECQSNCGWNGQFKGKLMNNGVFVAVVEYTDLLGPKRKSGTITLIN